MAPTTLSSDEDFASAVDELKAFALRLSERILAAHEVIGRRAERREVRLTEHDYCPLG
jgi:hypothetical protein